MKTNVVIALLIACLLGPAFLSAADQSNLPVVSVLPDGALTSKEIAALLGGYIWKLNVALPKDAKRASLSLQLTHKGHKPSDLGSGLTTDVPPGDKRDVLIAILPGAGSMADAEKVRIIIVGPDGVTACSEAFNPIKKLATCNTSPPEKTGDGTYNLLGIYEGSTVSPPLSNADQVISIKVEAQ